MTDAREELNAQLRKFEKRMPRKLAGFLHWLRQPQRFWVRIPFAIFFILFGLVGFLPLVGFWMIPVGLLLLAEDVPALAHPVARVLAWIDRKWPHKPAQPDPKSLPPQ
jgi:hypothetical protein